ncbi:MAG: tetratricopeptide repeat protein [Ignavibacteriaceae bacterium]
MGQFNIFLVLICVVKVFPQNYPDKVVDSLLKKGIDNIINQEYSQAKLNFTELDKKFPDLPFGKIYLAATEIAKSYDFSEGFNDDYIKENLAKAQEISEKLIDENEDNIWNIYFLALANGYLAYYDALNENWLSAFDNGYSSIINFEKCLNIDSTFYEAYTAIGAYKYWKSRKTEFIEWIPFIQSEKDEGIKYLEKAVKNSSYNTYLAINSLQWILIDQKKFNEAIEISNNVLLKYPNCRFFKWGLGRAYEDIDKQKAIEVFNEILRSYPQKQNLNNINKIILKHLIAQLYNQLGNYKSALKLCEEILSIRLDDFESSRLNERINRVMGMKDGLTKIISN